MQSDDKYKKVFSKNLNYYMNLRGKTQTDIVDDLDINKSAISSWCLGTRLPRMNKVEILADYLNINVSDLIEGSCENNNYFEFISEDDAMFPILDTGDIALVYKQNKLDNILTPNKGTYLIKLAGKNTIRKIELSENKAFYTLTAMNAYYKVINIPTDKLYNQIQIIGKVVKAENKSAFK
jgi:transcriptional regulator with XRE-family HTH domain|nr:MAG TPA: Repressor protein CI [Caudoviricetes sp.]